MKTAPSESQLTLVIFSWGAPKRLGPQIKRLGYKPEKVIWVDPLCGEKPMPLKIAKAAVTRIEAVVGKAAGDVELQRYSLPDLYSLTPPTEDLMALMPGLKVRSRVDAPALSGAAIAKKLAGAKGVLSVIIDTPGGEYAALECLEAHNLLDRVQTLALRCGADAFFEGAQDAQAVCDAVQLKGLTTAKLDDEDPDWPVYMFKPDPRAQAVKALEDDLRTRTKERDVARAAATKAIDIQRKLAADREALTKSRDAVQAKAAQSDEAQAELRAQIATLTAERNAAKTQAAKAGEVQVKLRAEHKKQTAQMTEKLLRADHEIQHQRIDLRRSAQVQERLLAEKDALQLRYTTAEQERAALKDLLGQLTPKLRDAAKQLRKLPATSQPLTLIDKAPAKSKTKKKKRT